jgi:hypothetical protein
MQATLENLREKMRQETENFLTEEMDSSSDPREAYAMLLRELRAEQGEEDVVPPTRPLRRRRPAA